MQEIFLLIQQSFAHYISQMSKYKSLQLLCIIAITQVMSLHCVVYVQKGYVVNNLFNICC